MKEIVISEKAKGAVSIREVVNKLKKLDERLESSKAMSNYLFKDLDKSSNSLESTEKRFFGGYNTKDLYNLITENHRADVSTTRTINEILKNSNENTKDMSEMLSTLALLSGVSFQKTSENTTELEEISKLLNIESNNSNNNSNNLKRVIISQIERVKEDNKKQENIDYNFGVLNSNFKELQIDFNELKKDYQKRTKDIKKLYQASSEDHFIKVLKAQKKMIYVLSFLFILSILFQILQFVK